MKVNMTASRNFRYAGRSLYTGDSFDATQRDSRVLALSKRAAVTPQQAPQQAPQKEVTARNIAANEQTQPIQTADIVTESVETADDVSPTHDDAAEVPRVKRAYRRRDMSAE